MGKTQLYATNILYVVPLFKTIDMFFGEFFLGPALGDKVILFKIEHFRA